MVIADEGAFEGNENTDKPSHDNLGCTLGKADFSQRPMSMRKFLEPFDHSNLTDKEASEKYAAYKAIFVKQQLEEFFEKNKNHAWFREKYHPDCMPDQSLKLRLLQRRLEVFMELYHSGLFDDLQLITGNETSIIKLLDTVAVKLAGGTEEDVRYLNEFKYAEVKPKEPALPMSAESRREIVADDAITSMTKKLENGLLTRAGKPERQSRGRTRKKGTEAIKEKQDKKPKKKVGGKEGGDAGEEVVDGKGKKTANRVTGRSSSESSSSRSSSSSSGSSTGSSSDSESSEGGTSSGDNSSSSSSSSVSESDSDGEATHRKHTSSGTVGRTSDRRAGKKEREQRSDEPSARRRRSSLSVRSGRSGSGSSRSSHSPKRIDSKANSPEPANEPVTVEEEEEHTADCGTVDHVTMDAGDELDQNTAGEKAEYVPVHRRPVHHACILYFPHIPLSVYQKDMIALLSTSPHFIRLAVLDPYVMPSSDSKTGKPDEPFFGIEADSTSPGIALRRLGWATFAAQTRENDQLVDVDVEAIRIKLLQQATEAQAPADMLECLRLAQSISDYLKLPPTHRARPDSFLMTQLIKSCPNRVYSKAVLRRHLVLAARLTYELDKARGLWKNSSDTGVKEQVVESPPRVEEPASVEAVPAEISDDFTNLNKSVDSAGSPNESMHENSPVKATPENLKKLELPVQELPSKLPVDPGEDLLSAATILSSLTSENPLLTGLTDYLVDEGSAEEELLLSGGFQAMSFASGFPNQPMLSDVNRLSDDTEMLRALDRLIFYLRVVHSVDFYAPALYPNEDAMPHPCQLIHLRSSKMEVTKALSKIKPLGDGHPKMAAYETLFANQLKRIIRLAHPLSEGDCKGLGLRSVEEVVDAFVKANTRRKKRKTDVIWVCPLSDKKFRDPIYVKKHIMNKHMEKVEAAKKDNAYFFNNYLKDPMRPQLPIEPRLPSKRRRSGSRVGSPKHESAKENEVASRERSATDHSDRRWYDQRNRSRDGDSFRPSFYSGQQNREYSQVSNQTRRPFGGNRMPYFQPRLPFAMQRGRFYGQGGGYGGMRRGYPRRPYVDLDAP
ncbi:unnamed protein product [Calicophoron daubneyi]|uniref:Serrate RNA effector molecule n=1 Tax=Calicophoron daubneyi TaxID=300641 RepID=A0AAV2T3I6_CALDB